MKTNIQLSNVPKRHHYIPQFILKNFCVDGQYVQFYDVANKQLSLQDKANIFMERNFYFDEINYPTMPIQIEKDLAKYESEVAIIIRNILDNNEIIITKKDYDSLILFFAIMSFRSKNASNSFNNDESKEFYKFWQEDGNLTDFWKRNLGILAKCRSIDEVVKSDADAPIKAFIMRDTCGLFGKYLIVFEKRGNEEFAIGDCYPVDETGTVEEGQTSFEMPMFDYFPISPNRLLVFASNGVENTPDEIRIFDKKMLKKPTMVNDSFIIRVNKLYEKEVKLINNEIINNSKIGIAFRDICTIKSLHIDVTND